jgi:hypothetical protein
MKRIISTAGRLLALLLPLTGLTAGCSIFDTGYPLARELQRTGIPAQAEILSIADTGVAINDSPVIRLEIEVRPRDRAPYRATIKKLLISSLEVPQYQPGLFIGVRFDPQDPSRVSVDLGPPPGPKTGEPFHDNFSPETDLAATILPAPASVQLYHGGADDAADRRALIENDYIALGASQFTGGTADPVQAAEQGKRIGAALVVLYGDVDGAAGESLAPLPFHPRPPGYAGSAPPAADTRGARATIGSLPPRPPGDHLATYWGKSQPPILGIMMRPLDDKEKARLTRNDGIVVELVSNDSPAAAAHLQPGDIILAIDGKPILDLAAMPAFLASVAGQRVRFDILRGGAPMAVDVQLNPSAH